VGVGIRVSVGMGVGVGVGVGMGIRVSMGVGMCVGAGGSHAASSCLYLSRHRARASSGTLKNTTEPYAKTTEWPCNGAESGGCRAEFSKERRTEFGFIVPACDASNHH
jgi:hypothetical protein